MTDAPRIMLAAPANERARYLTHAYAEVAADRARLNETLERLPSQISKQSLARWRTLANAGAFEPLAAELIEKHYDPAYDRASKRATRPPLEVLSLPDLEPHSIERAAEQVSALMASAFISRDS
jgi:tRNA 2-selenouridine synthase